MKNLFIPTDFSETAEEALRVAIQLGRRFHSRMHLFHFQEDPTAKAEAEAKLRQISQRADDLRWSISCQSGRSLQEEISGYVPRYGIDLVVMGSHGISGKSEYFIGSNTQKVVRTLRCPVLVIKEAPEEVAFDRVVFASSFNTEEREAFRRFKEFVKHFIPEIHLVAVQTSSLFEAPYIITREAMEDFRSLSHPFPCKLHIYKDFSVDRGVRALAQDIGANLIGISNHYRHPIRRMLVGSNVEALINHAHIPVLSIDYEEEEAES